MQIERHPTGLEAVRTVLVQQLKRPLRFQSIAGLVQELRLKGTVEVPIDVTTSSAAGLGVADLQRQLQSAGLQQIGLKPPLINQPGGIQLIAMGASDHKNIAAGHHDASVPPD